MDASKKTLLLNGSVLVLFVGMFFVQRDVLTTILPALAIAAWVYIGWRLLRRRRGAEVSEQPAAAPDRTVASAPGISGEILAPDPSTTIDPAELETYLSARIIGQERVAQQLARGIYRRMAQEQRGKPVFTVLLCGPTGTGKTELAKALAGYLFGGKAGLFRVDCANVLGEAGLQTLIGSPKGYAGSGTWGSLTAHLRANPQSVLLFDEVEKAVTSPNAPMAKLLLSLLDEGICTEQSDGTTVSATKAVIVLTSNAAQDKMGALFTRYSDQPEELVRATKDALRDYFAVEFLARIDLVTTLAPLSVEARARIVALHMGRIGATYGVEIEEIDASFVNEALRLWAGVEGYGTREVIRWIEQVTADDLIRAKQSGARTARIAWSGDRVAVTS